MSRHARTNPSRAGTAPASRPSAIHSAELDVGFRSGNGTMTVAAGGTVGNTDRRLARDAGSIATATVTGAGSTWTNTGTLDVGGLGGGTLSVAGGGLVSAGGGTGTVRVAAFAGSIGTLSIGAAAGDAAAAAGTLSAGTLAFGAGTRRLVFNQTGNAGASGISAWIAGYGSWGETDGDGNAAGLYRDSGGFLVGADGRFTETLRIGLMAGYGEASIDTGTRGSADVDTTSIGIYSGTELGGLSLKAGAADGFAEIDTAREVAFGTFRDSLTAGYDGETAQVFGKASYRFDVAPATTLSPFADIAHVSLDTDGFTERGGAAALSSGDDTADATFTTLGLCASTALPLGETALTASAMAGWRHAFGDTRPTDTQAFASGPAFSVFAAPLAENAAVVELGLGLDLTSAAQLSIHYAGQFGDGASDNGVNARLKLSF